MKYKKKLEIVDAIQWKGTEKSMREILDFSATDDVIWKPNSNTLTIIPNFSSNPLILRKDDWITKSNYGSLEKYESHMFSIYWEKYDTK